MRRSGYLYPFDRIGVFAVELISPLGVFIVYKGESYGIVTGVRALVARNGIALALFRKGYLLAAVNVRRLALLGNSYFSLFYYEFSRNRNGALVNIVLGNVCPYEISACVYGLFGAPLFCAYGSGVFKRNAFRFAIRLVRRLAVSPL